MPPKKIASPRAAGCRAGHWHAGFPGTRATGLGLAQRGTTRGAEILWEHWKEAGLRDLGGYTWHV